MPSLSKIVATSFVLGVALAQSSTPGVNQSCRPTGDPTCNYICVQPGDKDFCSPIDQTNALIGCQKCAAQSTQEACPLANFWTPLCAYTCTVPGSLGKCFASKQTGADVVGCTQCPGAPPDTAIDQSCRPTGDPACNYICVKPGVKDFCSPLDQSNALISCQKCAAQSTQEACPVAELWTPLCAYTCTVPGSLGKCYPDLQTGSNVIGCTQCPRGVSSGSSTGGSPTTIISGGNSSTSATQTPPPAYTGAATSLGVNVAAVFGLIAAFAFY
ncbi:hypothetical protein TWF694_003154 [Orbilia ellipsospora]|uniref:Uncharacterized protein n=1 Tax=Orbilia ellipsospora TaxID=2528407 RepID=A0AAV9X206_9PEZI